MHKFADRFFVGVRYINCKARCNPRSPPTHSTSREEQYCTFNHPHLSTFRRLPATFHPHGTPPQDIRNAEVNIRPFSICTTQSIPSQGLQNPNSSRSTSPHQSSSSLRHPSIHSIHPFPHWPIFPNLPSSSHSISKPAHTLASVPQTRPLITLAYLYDEYWYIVGSNNAALEKRNEGIWETRQLSLIHI